MSRFATAGATQKAGPRLEDRLATVQAILGDDLLWIERTLAECTAVGPAPATDAAKHLVVRGGKRVRPTALLLSAACFGSIPSAARELAVVSEMVHSATLLHDDVVDNGDERRGAPCARLLWGNGISVLAGDLLLVGALERTSVHAPDIMPDLIATLRRLVEGEIIQLRGRVALDVTEATYLRILRDKTASLFAWSTRTGARLAGATVEQQEGASRSSATGSASRSSSWTTCSTTRAIDREDAVRRFEGGQAHAASRARRRSPARSCCSCLSSASITGDQEPVLAVSQRGRRERHRATRCAAARASTRRARIEALGAVPPSPARALLQGVAEQLVARVG